MESIGVADVNQIVSGFQERMTKVALFDPLFELQRKKQTDLNGTSVDMMELGLLSLLFFFEQKLMRNQRAGVKDLATFLQIVTAERLHCNTILFTWMNSNSSNSAFSVPSVEPSLITIISYCG
jgi:hypothetical protein